MTTEQELLAALRRLNDQRAELDEKQAAIDEKVWAIEAKLNLIRMGKLGL